MAEYFVKRPVRAGEFVAAGDVYTCQMIVDWSVDEHGERGHDIACGRAAAYVFRGGHRDDAICAECFAALERDCQDDYRPIETPPAWSVWARLWAWIRGLLRPAAVEQFEIKSWSRDGHDYVIELASGWRVRGKVTVWFDDATLKRLDTSTESKLSELGRAIECGRHDHQYDYQYRAR